MAGNNGKGRGKGKSNGGGGSGKGKGKGGLVRSTAKNEPKSITVFSCGSAFDDSSAGSYYTGAPSVDWEAISKATRGQYGADSEAQARLLEVGNATKAVGKPVRPLDSASKVDMSVYGFENDGYDYTKHLRVTVIGDDPIADSITYQSVESIVSPTFDGSSDAFQGNPIENSDDEPEDASFGGRSYDPPKIKTASKDILEVLHELDEPELAILDNGVTSDCSNEEMSAEDEFCDLDGYFREIILPANINSQDGANEEDADQEENEFEDEWDGKCHNFRRNSSNEISFDKMLDKLAYDLETIDYENEIQTKSGVAIGSQNPGKYASFNVAGPKSGSKTHPLSKSVSYRPEDCSDDSDESCDQLDSEEDFHESDLEGNFEGDASDGHDLADIEEKLQKMVLRNAEIAAMSATPASSSSRNSRSEQQRLLDSQFNDFERSYAPETLGVGASEIWDCGISVASSSIRDTDCGLRNVEHKRHFLLAVDEFIEEQQVSTSVSDLFKSSGCPPITAALCRGASKSKASTDDFILQGENKEGERNPDLPANRKFRALYDGTGDGYASNDENENDENVHWDCQTVLTTYTNTENHPGVLRISGPKRKMQVQNNSEDGEDCKDSSIKHSAIENYKSTPYCVSEEDSESQEEEGVPNFCVSRPRNEDPEARRERKKMLKEERRQKRLDKKSLKIAFSDEKRRQEKLTEVRKLNTPNVFN